MNPVTSTLSTKDKPGRDAGVRSQAVPGSCLEDKMITKDKYGFTEDTETKLPSRAAKNKIDPIGKYLKSPGYIEGHRIANVRFDRFYFADSLVIDIFKKEGTGVDKEIQLKKRICKKEKIKYYPVLKGTDFMSSELKKVLKGA